MKYKVIVTTTLYSYISILLFLLGMRTPLTANFVTEAFKSATCTRQIISSVIETLRQESSLESRTTRTTLFSFVTKSLKLIVLTVWF